MPLPKNRQGKPDTPCHSCPKVPDDDPRGRVREAAIEPTEKSWQAYHHYRKCVAVQRWPEDEVVEANAAICAAVERAAEDARGAHAAALLGLLAAGGKR